MLYKHIILSGQSIPDTVQMQHFNAECFSLDELFIGNPHCDTGDLQYLPDLAESVVSGKAPDSRAASDERGSSPWWSAPACPSADCRNCSLSLHGRDNH